MLHKIIFLYILLFSITTAEAQNPKVIKPVLLTYIHISELELNDFEKYSNRKYNHNVWQIDTVSNVLYWYEENGKLSDVAKSKNFKNLIRTLKIIRSNKNNWHIENKPDEIDSETGGETFHYGLIISLKIHTNKIEVSEKNSFVKNYFYYDLPTAKAIIYKINKNTNNVKIAKHWHHDYWTSDKLKNGIQQYQDSSIAEMGNLGGNLIFNIDGTFIDYHIAPCGLDGGIHKYNGKWKLVNNKFIEIYDLKEEYNKAHHISIYKDGYDMIVLPNGKFEIIKIEGNILQIKKVENYEQQSAQKI